MITSLSYVTIVVGEGANDGIRPPIRPAIVQPTALTTTTGLDLSLVPALIADAGNSAGWRYVEFFTANIRNPNTRRAYARACGRFFAWCDGRGLTLTRSGRMMSPPI